MLRTTILATNRFEFIRFSAACMGKTGFLPKAFFVAHYDGVTYPADKFDAAMTEYRQWLVFDRYPANPDCDDTVEEDAMMLGTLPISL